MYFRASRAKVCVGVVYIKVNLPVDQRINTPNHQKVNSSESIAFCRRLKLRNPDQEHQNHWDHQQETEAAIQCLSTRESTCGFMDYYINRRKTLSLVGFYLTSKIP